MHCLCGIKILAFGICHVRSRHAFCKVKTVQERFKL